MERVLEWEFDNRNDAQRVVFVLNSKESKHWKFKNMWLKFMENRFVDVFDSLNLTHGTTLHKFEPHIFKFHQQVFGRRGIAEYKEPSVRTPKCPLQVEGYP